MAVETTTRRRALGLLTVAVIVGTVAACGSATGLPPDPPGVEPARTGAFSEVVRTADRDAQAAIVEQLASRFGKNLRVLPRSIDSDADPAPIKDYYDKAMIAGQGWKEFVLTENPVAWSFAYTSPDNRSVLAVVALNPRFAPQGGGNVPFSILTNLPETGGR
ncbi:hypothetical protein [Methylobacterium haplocladii]|uniref:Uncharacterized protein n=1 Tax=Methylobacterium haplocladii TaxID=1176176 RepID=A0A512IL97_9HYPH|nr:hypothetical protein [Methylobacterium haplocladii]GEO98493.1 hypothetical protein MHA02_08810 [Methylobacterium haplocladii]GJD82798.1 hypothetical protein HPGCJGGD_0659 [Methylobacterium haplocladii]GLS60197.1 hypothetical protein GCM10007887_28750 [Methylobacterium haplocladii]